MKGEKRSWVVFLIACIVLVLGLAPVEAQVAREKSDLTLQPKLGLFASTHCPTGIFAQSVMPAFLLSASGNVANQQQPNQGANPNNPGGALFFDRPTNIPEPQVGVPYSYSLCLGRQIPLSEAQECRPGNSNTVRGGSAANYRFQLQVGSYLPDGLTLDPYTGVISGTPKTAQQKPITICVRQLGLAAEQCDTFELRPTQPPGAQNQPAQNGGGGILRPRNLIIGIGVAAAGAAALGASGILQPEDGGGEDCGAAPAQQYSNACYNRVGSCNDAVAAYDAWCRCMGRGGFDRSRDRCQN